MRVQKWKFRVGVFQEIAKQGRSYTFCRYIVTHRKVVFSIFQQARIARLAPRQVVAFKPLNGVGAVTISCNLVWDLSIPPFCQHAAMKPGPVE